MVATEPIFSARNETIGWEEAYDNLQSQYQYTCCNFPLEVVKCLYSKLWKPAKEVNL